VDEAATTDQRTWLRDLFKETQQAIIFNELEVTRSFGDYVEDRPRFVLLSAAVASGTPRPFIKAPISESDHSTGTTGRPGQSDESDLLSAAERVYAAMNLAGAPRLSAGP
jgi:hypothetical protein